MIGYCRCNFSITFSFLPKKKRFLPRLTIGFETRYPALTIWSLTYTQFVYVTFMFTEMNALSKATPFVHYELVIIRVALFATQEPRITNYAVVTSEMFTYLSYDFQCLRSKHRHSWFAFDPEVPQICLQHARRCAANLDPRENAIS